jgi:hypothetical protein
MPYLLRIGHVGDDVNRPASSASDLFDRALQVPPVARSKDQARASPRCLFCGDEADSA